jgi:hypothetical protein
MRFAPVTGFGGLPYFFNLTRPVGKGYPHAPADDVAFVQFCFVVGAAGKPQPPPAEVQEAWSRVKVTGRTDDATLAAIDAWQRFRRARLGRRHETDGIVSVVPTASAYYAPDTSYDIVQLNLVVLVSTASIWPRVDRDPRCTPDLARAVRGAISHLLTP